MTDKEPVPSLTNMWQDVDRQIPATKTGDLVAYVVQHDGACFTSPSLVCRPALVRDEGGNENHQLWYDGVDDVLLPKEE